MAYLNRHDYFIGMIESKLSLVTNLNILNSFDVDKIKDYEFPFCYVEIANETLEYPLEDYKDSEGIIDFLIWIGVETTSDGDLRKVNSALTLEIEKVFKNCEFDSLTLSDYILSETNPRITNIMQVQNIEEIKVLYVISGKINYSFSWN